MRERVESAAAALRSGRAQVEPGKNRILDTRRSVIRGWLAVRETLLGEGREELANEVERFLAGMPPAQTEYEWMALALTERVREARQKQFSSREQMSFGR
jgi:hypothetical protein